MKQFLVSMALTLIALPTFSSSKAVSDADLIIAVLSWDKLRASFETTESIVQINPIIQIGQPLGVTVFTHNSFSDETCTIDVDVKILKDASALGGKVEKFGFNLREKQCYL